MKRFSALILLLVLLLSALISCDTVGKKPETTGTGDTASAETRDPNYDPTKVFGVKGKTYSLDNAAMSYLFNYHYGYYAANYYSYLSYIGLDVTKSLKDQASPEEGVTWFDYFMDDAVNSAKSMLALCDAAEQFGVKWDADDDAYLLELSDEIREAALSSPEVTPDKYIQASFGPDASFDAVIGVNRISHLASKVSEALYNSIEVTDADYDAYYEANIDRYLILPFYAYSFPKGTLTEEELPALKAKADAVAAASKDPDSFYEAIRPYIEEEGETYTLSYYYNEVGFGGNSDAEKWLWDEAREIGDATVIDSSAAYTVFLYSAEPHRDESRTASVRHILLDGSDEETKAQAEAILAEFLTDPTAEHFTALAAEHTTDPGFQSVGDLYADLREGDTVQAFNDWTFDPARQHGDTGIVLTEYGYHIMYFESFGDYVWKQDADEAIRNEKADAIMVPYFDAVVTDEAVLDMIVPFFPQ